MVTLFELTVATVILWSDGHVETLVNKYIYPTIEKCIEAQSYVERDRGQPPDKAFRAKHVAICDPKTIIP